MDESNAGRHGGGGEATFISQPNSLKNKVGIVPKDAPDPVAMAEQVIADHGVNYLERAGCELVALREAFDRGMARTAHRADALGRMFTLAHDMKGQGESFGYEMITKIAASLCDLLRDRTEMADAGMKVIKIHMDALAIVFEHDLKGDGGAHGRKLMDRLSTLSAI